MQTTETSLPRRPGPRGPRRHRNPHQLAVRAARLGGRLRDLRTRIGISHETIVRESAKIAREMGIGYEPITRQILSHVENGRMHLTKDGPRAILCRIFDLNRDELADYLDGKTPLAAVLAAREERVRQRAVG